MADTRIANPEARTVVAVRVPPEHRRGLDAVAQRRGVTASELLRAAVARLLAEEDAQLAS